jgi:hypothetical protein
MGVLNASVAIGIVNGPCSTLLQPPFNLYNASVNNSAANVLGPADMYWVLKDKTANPIPYSKWNPQLPDYLEGYPHFLNDMLDPDGPLGPKPPLQPRARYAGHNYVAGMNIIIQFIVLDPGQLTQLGGIYAQMSAAIGYPNLIVLNNPVNQEEAPGAISDFCTPLTTTTILYATTVANPYDGSGAGYSAQTNPAANTGVLLTGTHMSRNYSRSERDADGDGIENDLDPCPYTSDVGWDPRVDGAQPRKDSDNDHLPDSCDPVPGTSNTDQDGDGYNNRQDICPLVANGQAQDNQADRDSERLSGDLGPNPDSIGDACDDSDNDGKEDGSSTGVPGSSNCTDGIDNDGDTKTDVLDPQCIPWMDKTDANPWGTSPGTGYWHHAMPWAAVCVGATDSDGDGYCDALETLLDSDPNNGPETGAQCTNNTDDDSDGYVNDGCPQVGKYIEKGVECANALDNDGDTNVNDGCPAKDDPEDPSCADDLDENTQLPNHEGDAGPDKVNDGCPKKATNDDLPDDFVINDGCLAVGPAETGAACTNNIDDDADTTVNDGCDQVGSVAEVGPQCTDPETGLQCDNALDDDGDTTVNDGCPAIGQPERPDCINAIDDDGDSYGDACDNCRTTTSEDQTNTDRNVLDAGGAWLQIGGKNAWYSDPLGDVCDSDDDNDFYSDTIETYLSTNPLDNCPKAGGPGTGGDSWVLDVNVTSDLSVTGDVFSYVGRIGATPGSPNWSQRLDFDQDSSLSVSGDVFMYVGKIGATCT